MRGNKEAGFTLIELMVGVSMWMVVAAGLAGSFKQGLHLWKQTEKKTPLYQEARVTLEHIAREFRHAMDVPGKNWSVNETSIAFSTLDSHSISRVTYRLVSQSEISVLERLQEPLTPARAHRPIQKTAMTTRPTEMRWEYAYTTATEPLGWRAEWKRLSGQSLPTGVRVHITLYDENNEPVTFTKTMFLPTTEEI